MDESEIRDRVRQEVHLELWRRRAELFPHSVSTVADILPIDLNIVSTNIYSLGVFDVAEITPENPFITDAGFETAGFLDRELHIIEISRKFPHACQRYTWAHELGHFALHPDLRQHRDLPLIGTEREHKGRQPPKEREADIFASELLMPARPTRDIFLLAHLTPVDPLHADEHLAYSLSRGTGRSVTVDRLQQEGQQGRRYRSRLLAETRNARGHEVRPISEIFDVSPEAMAIRLEELGLIF
jgi:hypothetical protein